MECVRNGDLEGIKQAIDEGASIHCYDLVSIDKFSLIEIELTLCSIVEKNCIIFRQLFCST